MAPQRQLVMRPNLGSRRCSCNVGIENNRHHRRSVIVAPLWALNSVVRVRSGADRLDLWRLKGHLNERPMARALLAGRAFR